MIVGCQRGNVRMAKQAQPLILKGDKQYSLSPAPFGLLRMMAFCTTSLQLSGYVTSQDIPRRIRSFVLRPNVRSTMRCKPSLALARPAAHDSSSTIAADSALRGFNSLCRTDMLALAIVRAVRLNLNKSAISMCRRGIIALSRTYCTLSHNGMPRQNGRVATRSQTCSSFFASLSQS